MELARSGRTPEENRSSRAGHGTGVERLAFIRNNLADVLAQGPCHHNHFFMAHAGTAGEIVRIRPIPHRPTGTILAHSLQASFGVAYSLA